MPYTMPAKKRTQGGDSASPSSGGSASSATPAQAAPGYVNFSRILSANQQGAQSMADNLAGQVQQQGQQAQGAIEGAAKGFKDQVASGTARYGGQQQEFPTNAGGGEDPGAYRAAGAAARQRGAGATYKGPKDWQGAGYDTVAMASQAAQAQDAAKALTTAGGRGAMLRQQAGGPYSAGMSALDSALSGAALGTRGQDLATLYGGLSQRLADYQGQGDAAVKEAQEISASTQDQYNADADVYDSHANTLEQQRQVPEMLAAPPPGSTTTPPKKRGFGSYLPRFPSRSGGR